MLDGVFARGTTPTQIFPIPGGLTKSDFLDFTISYRQKGKTILIKRKEDSYGKVDDEIFMIDNFKFYPFRLISTDEIDMAYAITIHKSQGSDYQNILIIIP